MAGSRRWFGYVANNNDNFAVELDESVYETPALGFGSVAAGAPTLQVTATRPLAMRYINCSRVLSTGETQRQKFYVGTAAALAALETAATVTIGGVAWGISSVRGEQRKLVPATDTALLDGDTDANFAA